MPTILAFILGVANFAAHKAVFESGHAMLANLSPRGFTMARVASLAVEMVLLVLAMHAAFVGELGWLWAYLGYSALNFLSAWLFLSRRI